jgi:hypothetical protein
MIREPATNADSYLIPESHIQRVSTREGDTHADSESVRDAASRILKYPLPEWRSMDIAYGEIARRLYQIAPASLPIPSGEGQDDLYSFDALPDLDALSAAQGVQPIENIDDLVTDLWPGDESVEDFIAAATEGRYEEEDEPEF